MNSGRSPPFASKRTSARMAPPAAASLNAYASHSTKISSWSLSASKASVSRQFVVRWDRKRLYEPFCPGWHVLKPTQLFGPVVGRHAVAPRDETVHSRPRLSVHVKVYFGNAGVHHIAQFLHLNPVKLWSLPVSIAHGVPPPPAPYE